MLNSLHIENIAVAKNIDISFLEGFHVLTGETGAGKSIIVDSINFILGAKVSRDIIRHGEDKCLVFAAFSGLNSDFYRLCDTLSIEYDKDDYFAISRQMNTDGKNVVKINGKLATLSDLKELSPFLINIHGQNESFGFMNTQNQGAILDEYADITSELSDYAKDYALLSQLKSEIIQYKKDNAQKELLSDILENQIKEIEQAKLSNPNEEEELLSLRLKLKNSEKLIKSTSKVVHMLEKSDSGVTASALIDYAIDSLAKIEEYDASIHEYIEKLTAYKFEIVDIAERVADLSGVSDASSAEERLNEVESRLAYIQKLEKKYGASIPEVLKFYQDAKEKLKKFDSADEKIEELSEEYRKLYQEATKIAEILHEKRERASEKLSKIVMESLDFLDMPKVSFSIDVTKVQKDGKNVLSSRGFDEIEFMIATNVGETRMSMSKVASGGELSRIMLAIKSALSDKNGAGTIIFDEIDTGVSGKTSQKIGLKLNQLSKNAQIICVTHSAQIASVANHHFVISKQEVNGRAEAFVKELTEEEKISEIARIIGGISLTQKQYDAAKELLRQAKELK